MITFLRVYTHAAEKMQAAATETVIIYSRIALV